MAKRKVVSVGWRVPGDHIEYIDLAERRSLMDADVVLFSPALRSELGGPLPGVSPSKEVALSEAKAGAFFDEWSHWRRELTQAAESGKTIIAFLSNPIRVRVIRANRPVVWTSHHSIPHNFSDTIAASGTRIKQASDLRGLEPYWKAFGDSSPYQFHFKSSGLIPLLYQPTGDRLVGALLTLPSGGEIYLVPPIDFDTFLFPFEQTEEVNKAYIAFGARLLAAAIAVDTLRSGADQTPVPEWAEGSQYRLEGEKQLEAQAIALSAQMDTLAGKRAQIEQQRAQEASSRELLYGQGKPLERALIDGLRVLGFSAEGHEEGESQFDILFESAEGRFLGEAEGRDSKAIQIEKLSQLTRNVMEDVQREGIATPAVGVLFGNAYRLTPPGEREAFFTPKCVSTAAAFHLVLCRTTDLFDVVKYVKDSGDQQYALMCRQALAAAIGGQVIFPALPISHPPTAVVPSEPEEEA